MPGAIRKHALGGRAPSRVDEFEYLLAHFPGAVSIYDSNLVLLAANELHYAMTGLPRNGFGPGVTYADIVRHLARAGAYGEVDIEATVAARVRALRSLPWKFERKQGERYIVGHAVATPDGGVICCQQDLTEQKRTEERLREEIKERQAVERELLSTNAALEDTQTAIRNLLDNADQGFLSIDQSLIAGQQYSAACAAILGEPPAGKPIIDLLCRGAADGVAADMRATLESLLADEDSFSRELKIGLLPTAFEVGGKSIKVHYKHLSNVGRLMLVMTDVTETTRLAKQVELGRLRLEMIVLAVTEGETFKSLVEDYSRFLDEELSELAARRAASIASGELYRRLHTYKGLLAQFHFHWSPKRLHEMETTLSKAEAWTSEEAKAALDPAPLRVALDRDLAALTEVLGGDFFSESGRVAISAEALEKAVGITREVLARELRRADARRLRELLRLLLECGRSEVKAMLALHARGVPALAERLGKLVKPVTVEGNEATLDPDRCAAFFRSLVHVFRNAVDHGVETPEERLDAGKPAEAAISCAVRNLGGRLEIEIRDDGRGVDRAALEARFVVKGGAAEAAAAMSLEDLVFLEGLSSRETASETSGRGVGLAAVKQELETLGGSVSVTSEPGVGASFKFLLPYETDEAADAAPSRKVA
jgi:two-component system chemotaxis sensor kinase CheA